MQKFQLSVLFLFFYFFSQSVFGQNPEEIKLSGSLVIENVRLVQKPGDVPKKSTIVIEDGIITQIGSNVTIPPNSISIKGDSLYAYSAFIDACSHSGIPKADKDNKREEVKDPDNPGWKRAGITPQETVRDLLKMTDNSVKSMRDAGFAISHVVPRGRMLPGMGSIILLNDHSTTSILKENASMYGTLQSAQGRVYPSTIIAVMAKYRELIMQARNSQKHETSYNANPIGMKRPDYPKEIQALYPVVSNKLPFFMHAEKTLDISRAIALNKDLKLNMTIVEAKQAWHNLDKLKKHQIPLILSLNIPDDLEEEKKDSITYVDPEREELIVRRKTAIAEYQSQFKVLKESNIPISFSFLDTKPNDIHKNLLKLVEKEVKPEELHASLTTNPAKLLGIDNISGTVEKGKLGNIILTDKTLFEKEMNIHYTIVEGESYKHEVKAKKKKKKKGDNDEISDQDISGKWDVTVSVPGDEQSVQLVFNKDGDEYSGILIDDEGEETSLENISIDRQDLSFTFTVNNEGMTLDMEIHAEVTEDTLKGSVSVGEFGTFPLEGTKLAGPKN